MFIAKCPLRIGLVGGSTDLEGFIQQYGYGKIISFPTTLNVYITIHNNNQDLYIIDYSITEKCKNITDVKNDIARVALEYFNPGPITISFLSDIISSGSGLASSTAYMVAIIKALSLYTNKHLTEFEICKLAIKLERKYNPLVGYQDAYGCGIGGFKKIVFKKDKSPNFTYYNADFIRNNFDLALFHTEVIRNSTNIIMTYDINNSFGLLDKVSIAENAIENNDIDEFIKVFNESWMIKKNNSNLIMGNKDLKQWDIILNKNKNILGTKLCGAGGDGYFLTLCKKGRTPKNINGSNAIAIGINEAGVVGQRF